MQCAHGVVSMRHSLSGALELNGETLDFSDGTGYIETDRGRSFPTKYLWTQCAWDGAENSSLMLAVATIPLPVGGFTGCICSVFHGGREYRLATYRGARIEAWSSSAAVIRQGKYRLEAALLNERRQALRVKWSRFSNFFIEKRGSSFAQALAVSKFQQLYCMSAVSQNLQNTK